MGTARRQYTDEFKREATPDGETKRLAQAL